MKTDTPLDSPKLPPEYLSAVIDKLQSLEPQQVYVVSNLIDFLQHQRAETESSLSQDFMRLSSESLWKIWDNDEDAIYDTL